jgi:hypothetical protein
LTGLGLINAKIPELFPERFFDVATLSKIFSAGIAQYQDMCAKYHTSGNHGGKPYWHFVAPTMTTKQEEQHLHLNVPTKRWDSLAFYMMFEQVQALKRVFCKPIPNGKGGPATATLEKGDCIRRVLLFVTQNTGASPRELYASKKARDDNYAEKRMAMDVELHGLQVALLKTESSSATPQKASLSADSKWIREAIRDSLKMKKEFMELGDDEMVQHETDIIVNLKLQLRALPSHEVEKE